LAILIDTNRLPAVFDEVRKVRDAIDRYCLAPDKIPVSLDDIQAAIWELYVVRVTTRLIPLNSQLLRGVIEIYSNSAIIYVDANLNLANTRYVIAKEICHIMLMMAENCTIDPVVIVEYFVQDGILGNSTPSHELIVMYEELTKFGAIELLFPYHIRAGSMKKLAAGTETLFTLSEWLRMPENIVEFALSDKYMALCDKIYQNKR